MAISDVGAEPDTRFTIGDLAGLVGLKPATLRSWQDHYDFPVAHRSPDGTRSYRFDQIEAVRSVLRMREAGLPLEHAISAVSARLVAASPSVFRAVREVRPDLEVKHVEKRDLIGASRDLEEACSGAADSPLFLGAFQSREFYLPSQARWARLAESARGTIVIGGYPALVEHVGRPAPVLVPLDARAALRREWIVVTESRAFSSVLAARELDAVEPENDLDRLFEAVLTDDPVAVRTAALVCARVAAAAGSVLGEQLVAEFRD